MILGRRREEDVMRSVVMGVREGERGNVRGFKVCVCVYVCVCIVCASVRVRNGQYLTANEVGRICVTTSS